MQLYKSGRPKELYPLTDHEKCPPNAKGEYRILSKDNKTPVYVGVSNNLNRRMKEHLRSGKISEENPIFAYQKADGRASQSKINDHERKKIIKHNPELNQRAGGAGRPYKHTKPAK